VRRKISILAAALLAAGCGHMQQEAAAPAKVELSKAANPTVPQGTPVWKQGLDDPTQQTTTAPHPPKLTVTPVADIPVRQLKVPAGFQVEVWAHGMPGARMMARGPGGKVYVGTRGIGRVYEVTDSGGNRTTRVFAEKLTQPNGLAFNGKSLYVMAIDKVLRYDDVESNANAQPVDMTAAFKLPPKQHHNWKFLQAGPDGKLYVPFGAPCNICDVEPEYAQIRRYNWDGSGMEVVARGVRNSVGFDFHPRTKELWFTDNGRDWGGDDGHDDELNRVTKVGEFFGFPYCHANGVPDKDVKKANACQGVTMPVTLLGPHVAALGMRFYTGSMFPSEYRDSIFIARHGSWNRTKKTGFDVVRVTAGADGRNAKVEPFMTGFLDAGNDKFVGRPTDVLVMPDGAMLVSDEQNGAIYRVSYKK
jgi:glucose/arabinose dehydrogenase